MTTHTPSRPTAFVIGALVTAFFDVFGLIAVTGIFVLTSLGLGVGGMASATEEAFGLFMASGIVGFVGLVGILFFTAQLLITWLAWNGNRAGIALLIGMSILGILVSGGLSVPLGILTIVGSIQWLEALKEEPVPA